MAVEIGALIGKSLAVGFILFVLSLVVYFTGFYKEFALIKHRKKFREAKTFMLDLDLRFPPNTTMEPKLREERTREMIKSGYPPILLEKAQKLIAKDKNKLNKEVKKNGLRLHKTKPTSTTTSTTTATSTADTTTSGTTSGSRDNGGNKESKQLGVLPISETPNPKRTKPNFEWNW